MADYTLTLTDEDDATLRYQTERFNALRLGGTGPLYDGPPIEPLTPTQVLSLRVARELEATRQQLDATVRPVEAMLLPLTPAQRTVLIDRIPSAAVRQRIVDLLRNR